MYTSKYRNHNGWWFEVLNDLFPCHRFNIPLKTFLRINGGGLGVPPLAAPGPPGKFFGFHRVSPWGWGCSKIVVNEKMKIIKKGLKGGPKNAVAGNFPYVEKLLHPPTPGRFRPPKAI